MKHRVKRVFEQDLDGMLDEIDRAGGELVRILDLPKGRLSTSECSLCKKDGAFCDAHDTVVSHLETLKSPGYEAIIIMPRYAVVYKEPDPTGIPRSGVAG